MRYACLCYYHFIARLRRSHDKYSILCFIGHGFCTDCIFRLCSEPRPKCPNCRVVLHGRDAHPVHIDFIDTQTHLQKSVVDGLNQMGADTPLISVKRASQKLGRISEGSNADIVRIFPFSYQVTQLLFKSHFWFER